MNVYRGVAPLWRTRRDPTTGLFEPADTPEWSYPMAYGYAAVGRVVERGSEVTGIEVGQIVYTNTPHSSASVVDASSVVVLPELDDARVAVLDANLNTALNGVLDAHPSFGDVVVVSGLGVIGLIVVQLLARLGVTIVGLDALEYRRDLARRFGADLVLTPGTDVAARVRAITHNRGADIVIEVSGASGALNEAIRIAGYCGTIIAMSWYGGTFESLNLAGEFHHNRPRIVASQVGGLNPHLGPLWSLARRQELAARLMKELDLTSLLTHQFDVEDAATAYALIDSRPEGLVQCLISYGGEAEM